MSGQGGKWTRGEVDKGKWMRKKWKRGEMDKGRSGQERGQGEVDRGTWTRGSG